MAKDCFVITREIVYPMNDRVNTASSAPLIIPDAARIENTAFALLRNINHDLTYSCDLLWYYCLPPAVNWICFHIFHEFFNEVSSVNYAFSVGDVSSELFPPLTMFRVDMDVNIEDDTNIDPTMWVIFSITFSNTVDINDPDGVFI